MKRIFRKAFPDQSPIFLLIGICLSIFPVSCGSDETNDQPRTNPIYPSSGYWGEVIRIAGNDFGHEQQSSMILFGGDVIASKVISWSDKEIVCLVPLGSITGPLTVLVDNVPTLSADFIVENIGGMIVHLKPNLDFSSQLIEDVSGNENHGMIEGPAEWASDRFGNPGRAISFQGNGAHILLNKSSSLRRIAGLVLSVSIKLNQSGFAQTNSMTLLHKDSYFSLEAVSAGENWLYVFFARDRAGTSYLTSSYPHVDIPATRFVKVTAVFDSSEPLMGIYVDDELVGRNNSTIGQMIVDVTNETYIGIDPHEENHLFGILEDVFIFELRD